MDTKKARAILDKINPLLDRVEAGSAGSQLDRDILLDYIRQLYDSVMFPSAVEAVKNEPVLPPTPTPPPAPKPEEKKPVIVYQEEPKPQPKVETPPPPPALKPIVETPKPVVEAPKPVFEAPKPVPPPPAPAKKPASSEEVEALFAFSIGTDISEKLAMSPIKDLKSSMSINDRILYVNELFAGSSPTFEATLDSLNRFTSFAEAKTYLIDNFVSNNNWLVKEKAKSAKGFAKLVYRRYL